MEVAKALIRCVARAFYDTKHILVLDALMIHNAVRDDELSKLLGMQTKDVHKLVGKLREDRMVMVHTRQETREGQQRPTGRTYYYVEFRATIDAIKYRMHVIAKEVENKMNKDVDQKGYVCPRCQKRYAVLDAVVLQTDESGLFLCDQCGTSLIDDDDSTEVKDSQQRLKRFHEQTAKVIHFMKEVDEVVVPLNDFETAINNAVPVPTAQNQQGSVPAQPAGKAAAARAAAQPSLQIDIRSDPEKTAAELAADQLRKQQQAEKNALPVWHTQSTVREGDVTNAGMKEAAERRQRETDGLSITAKNNEEKDKTTAANGTDTEMAIAAYYAEQARKTAEENEEEEEDDDDDDDEEEAEFEDVDVNGESAATSNVPTPAPAAVPKPTNNNTATASEEDGEPPGKKVKLDTPEDDSEEEADFEDL